MIADGMNDRIKRARVAAGYGRRRFARAIDAACSPQTVFRWEQEGTQSLPTLYYAMRICDVCGVTLDWLMYGDEITEYTGRYTADVRGSSIGQRIRHRRGTLGMTQAELAAIIGSSQSKIYQWEREMCQPTLYYIDRLCAALRVSADAMTKEASEK